MDDHGIYLPGEQPQFGGQHWKGGYRSHSPWDEFNQMRTTMRMSFPKAFLSGCVFLLVLATTMNTVLAHHSFSAFNMNEEKTVTGIVKEVEWTNPHIWIWIDVKDEKGVASTYGFEGMSPNFLERRNWTRTTLKVGDKVT